MDDIRLKLMKYSIVIILVIFVGVVFNAFKYLPNGNMKTVSGKSSSINEEYENPTRKEYQDNRYEENESEYSNEDVEEEPIQERRSKKIINEGVLEDDVPEDIIDLPVITTPKVSSEDLFNKAKMLTSQNKYESAVYEYQKIAKTTSDKKVESKCYEEMSNIYASLRRYNAALSLAKQAYDIEASEKMKEVLIELYNKTGNYDKAEDLKSVNQNIEPKQEEINSTETQKQKGEIEELEKI